MNAPKFRFQLGLRVRWAEVDMQKIVFNGHYLMYVDTAMAGYWRALGLDYAPAMARWQGDLFVKKATLEYHAAAEYDDELTVGLRCGGIGRSSIRFEAQVSRGHERLVSGELVYVFAHPELRQSRALPEAFRAILEGYEAGESMLKIECGAWSDLSARCSALRDEVFVREQQIPLLMAMDESDTGALHVLASNRVGEGVGTGRLSPADGNGISQIGRMAVRRPLRGGGCGTAMLHALLDMAKQRGDSAVRLDAQASAMGFYARHGFRPEGEPFEAAGRLHQRMVHALACRPQAERNGSV